MSNFTNYLLGAILLGTSLTARAQQPVTNDPTSTVGDTGTVTFTYRGSKVTYVTVRGADGNIWLQQNLGSTEVATSSTDVNSYGDLFQWGRWDDGHQLRTSNTAQASTLTNNNPAGLNSGTNLFYIGANPADWWGAGAGTDTWSQDAVTTANGYDPCMALGLMPGTSWHMPTKAEWAGIGAAENIQSVADGFNSNLKLPAAGSRDGASGTIINAGAYGNYWSSSASGVYATDMTLATPPNFADDAYRSYGMSVRCISTCTHAPQPTAILGDDTVCSGGTYLYHVDPVPNAIGYTWTLPPAWSGNSLTDSIWVTIPGTYGGTISVKAFTNCNDGTSPAQYVGVNISAPNAIINIDGNILGTTMPFNTYQWYKDGQLIAGATDSDYVVAANGNYSVVVTGARGCADTSDAYPVTSLAVSNVNKLASGVSIYPNPAQDVVHINTADLVNVSVRSIAGKTVLQQQATKQINISSLANGIYVIYITDNEGQLLHIEKLTKNKEQ